MRPCGEKHEGRHVEKEDGLKVGEEAHPLRPPGVADRPSIVNGKTGSGEVGAMTNGTQHGNLSLDQQWTQESHDSRWDQSERWGISRR